ncbi:MazG-like family protein [Desulfofundulus thermocisternus]|uniref:MazG-like family protein n=1 Tax=Desulfofundulus thermocisternus TaxID=42471 RepID=UPI0019E8DA61|nr:MazG-like family protein [Desulfofundulus thermocisternus]MBE3586750.1 MazG-like family protein [Thermoanaerobacter sp.]MCS5697030.1 MazG-like family protein [Desulfofundulus thermocisternus]
MFGPQGHQDTGIAKNIRVIEWLKADLLASLAALYRAMLRGSEERLLDAFSSIIITCYVLGRRLGISFTRMDLKLENKLRQGIEEGHEMERWYGDLSALLAHLVEKKR